MEKEEYFNIYNLERNHWWYRGMRYLSFNLIKKYLKNKLEILDAGCGAGINIIYFMKYGKVIGIDNSDYAIKLCRKRKLNVKKASIENLPFKRETFDIITCFEVIYHKAVKNDINALKEMNRVLKKGGILLIRVPAYKFLFSGHDKIVHTKRRYTLNELKNKLVKSNFKIGKISYINSFLFPIIFLSRIFKNIFGMEDSNIKKTNLFFSKIFYTSLVLESKLLKLFNFPFGVSIIAVARKSN